MRGAALDKKLCWELR